MGYQDDLFKTHHRKMTGQGSKKKVPTVKTSPFSMTTHVQISLLTATEKQVLKARLYMGPIQWHLKSNWYVPESSDKNIPAFRALHTCTGG